MRRLVLVVALGLSAAVGCDDPSVEVENEVGPRPDGGGRCDADCGEDAGDAGDGGEVTDPGSMTWVVRDYNVEIARLCDVDGDGENDNSVADLGGGDASLLATVLTQILSSDESRMVIHLPLVDDRRGPDDDDATLLVLEGADTDDPPAPADDFSGEEPFWARASSLDACGEPVHHCRATIDAGAIDVSLPAFPLPIGEGVPLLQARLEAEPNEDEDSIEGTVCGRLSADDLAVQNRYTSMTFLDIFLTGDDPISTGIPAVPGLQPDVDEDGDGLEVLEVDDLGRLARCVDGDGTIIEGRECWSDERIADTFSFTVRFWAVPARYAGREPAWQFDVDELCEDGPPEESLFGPGSSSASCVASGEVCNPRAAAPCCDPEARCSGVSGEAYRCLAPCEPSACDYGGQPGFCRPVGGGLLLCEPLLRRVNEATCYTDPCTTPFGASTSTHCVTDDETRLCLEECTSELTGCAPGSCCMPLVSEPGGVCVPSEHCQL